MKRLPLFDALGFLEATELTRRAGRWLLVYANAERCQPCKQMERVTWRDPSLRAWVKQRATAIQLDIDRNEGIARLLDIRSVPTVIAFKDGLEVDRIPGLLSASGMVDWLQGLEQGETAPDRVRRTIGDPTKNMGGRLDLAGVLASSNRLSEATDEYVWLWHHIVEVEPAMLGVRTTFMANEIRELVRRHEYARARFRQIRETAAAAADTEAPLGRARLDWIVLNEILGEDEATVEWFDRLAADVVASRAIGRFERRLVRLLLARGRWADAGRLHSAPKRELLDRHELLRRWTEGPMLLDREARRNSRSAAERRFRNKAAVLYAMLLAAGRVAEAKELEALALRLDASDAMRDALHEMAGRVRSGPRGGP